MSRRSVLLATTVCVALGTSAAIDEASAHSDDASGSGFRSPGDSMARVWSLPATPAEHITPIAHTKVMTKGSSQFTYHKVFKAGNGVTPTSDPTTHTIGTITTKPTVPPAVNQPPQVATQSVPPAPPTATPPGNPVGNGVPAKPVALGVLAGNVALPSSVFPAPTATPPGNPVGNGLPPTPIKAGTIVSKPGINPEWMGLKVIVLPGPTQSPQPTKPGQTPPTQPTQPMQPMHPMPGVLGGGGVVVAADDVALTDDMGQTCFWIKRKFLTEDGEVIRRVKVCEISDADQP